MKDEIKKLLNKHKYVLKVTLDPQTGLIQLHIPKRLQEPQVDAYTHDYLILDNMVYITIDGNTTEIECPTYACRTLIFVDIRTICNYIDFDPSLLEFYNGQDKISEEEFFQAMLMKGVNFTDAMRKQENDLRELVGRAINSIIPFHQSFYYEAQKMGVGLGYGLIAAFALGDSNE